jgi:hypothetical protein
MTITEVPAEAQNVVRLRQQRDLVDVDYKRELRRLSKRGYSQTRLSQLLHISQPSVFSALQTAEKVRDVVEGFSGADPYEICQRYAAGIIERAQLVDELARWNYAPSPTTDGYDWLATPEAGTWGDVERANAMGLIDPSVYEEVFNRLVADAETNG